MRAIAFENSLSYCFYIITILELLEKHNLSKFRPSLSTTPADYISNASNATTTDADGHGLSSALIAAGLLLAPLGCNWGAGVG